MTKTGISTAPPPGGRGTGVAPRVTSPAGALALPTSTGFGECVSLISDPFHGVILGEFLGGVDLHELDLDPRGIVVEEGDIALGMRVAAGHLAGFAFAQTRAVLLGVLQRLL